MALQHLRSSTANKRPTPAVMADGQVAMNTNLASPGLFFKDSNGDLVKVGPVHVGTTAPNATPGVGGETGNSVGEQWLDTSSSRYVFKIWDGTAWRTEDGEFVNSSGDTMTGALGIIAGSAASPSLFISGDTNTGIYSPGADQLAISTNAVERLRIDATGNVAIGSTSPGNQNTAASRLVVGNTSANNGITILTGTSNDGVLNFNDGENTSLRGYLIYEHSTDSLRLGSAGSERARIDSSGRLLLGTSSALDASAGRQLQVSDANGAFLILGRDDTTVGDGPALGGVHFYGNDTTSNAWTKLGAIDCSSDGTHAAGDNPTRLVFSTTADGASTPTERMRITSAGLVGIGATSPAELLDVNGKALFGQIKVGSNTVSTTTDIELTANSVIRSSDSIRNVVDTSGFFGWNIGGSDSSAGTSGSTEVVRIDSSGRLLVGVSTSSGSDATLQVIGAPGLQVHRGINGVQASQITISKSRNTTYGSNTIVQNNDTIGQVVFRADDGTDYQTVAALISAEVDGTPGVDDMPGRLVFSTTADGASSPTERMRIDSSGLCSINTSDADGYLLNLERNTQVLKVDCTGSADVVGAYFRHGRGLSGFAGKMITFRRNDNTEVGSVVIGVSSVAYNTSSDYRLKENVAEISEAVERVLQLNPVKFNFIDDPDRTVDGFIAHEAQAVVPECVTGEKDAVDDDGNPVYQGIDQSKLVPLLTAALQEALAEISALKDRVTALEAQ